MNVWIFLVVYFVAEAVVQGNIKVIKGLNPGPCTKSTRGAVVLIRDRKGNNQLLSCNKKNGVLYWSPINNDVSPTGEIFNPGYDCTSILDHNPEAKDGFFWITLNKKRPKKVWCDMKTDGGGYMLIGRKNNSITWSVSSSDDPVEPFGKPHWCCSFGGVDIVDFRVQMASKEDFKMTKAHWAYRLRNPRKLSNLMITNKGCSPNDPGIGDIAYVKDLATGAIATSSFRCSKFGIGHHPRTRTGWTMMNSCLQKPCPWGFAYHSKYPIQLDYSGSFSYSVSNSISGIESGATAVVGCNNGHCCGCHGPLHGKLNYCFQKCRARNGGTIEPNVFTWFWVRTSVSKKMWRKCMDYKVEENGIHVWYKLVGTSEVPVEGRCDRQNKAIMYDGMLVASDNTAARKALLVPGMIVYRQDNKKLYIAKDEKLNALAEERKTMEKINSLNQKVVSLVEEGKALNKSLNNFADLMWKALKELELKTVRVGHYHNPGKSCLDILKRRKGETLSNGGYWIFLGNKAVKVYCDMKADGGGWTLVSNLVLKHSSGMYYSLTNDYHQINEYDNSKLALSTHALRALGMKMPFQQLRFFCHKRRPGRTFDIATNNNRNGNLVVQYFKAQTNTMPNSCGSYYRLPDDNSELARQCARWGYHHSRYFVGKWHHGGYATDNRLFNHLAFVGGNHHWLVERSSSGRWECDDFKYNRGYATSRGDFWKIFVR